MVVLLLIMLGFISLSRINIDLYPDITFPGAAVVSTYEGVGPEEMETLVTKPLESALSTVTNVNSVSSTSSSGQSTIVMEFNWGSDIDMAVMDMREQVDMVSGMLPDGVNDPLIFKFDPAMMPILQFGVSNGGDLEKLKNTVEDRVIPRLERIEGVASVDITGGLDRQILISVDQNKMENYGISFSTITSTLMQENMNVSGGNVVRARRNLLVRTTGKFENLEQIKNLLITNNNGTMVKLAEIAKVEDTFKKMQTIARLNQSPSVGMMIQKQTDANTVKVSNLVKEEIEKIKTDLNNNLKIIPAMDQSEFIEDSINGVKNNAIIGGLLAIIILFLFLRNVRSTIIIGTAIPVSIITTFLLIYFGGLTINILSLGGLALGVGMLVDNAIVVLENIYRYRSLGLDKEEAAHKGSTEVGMAITASTLTTVIVFLPIVFVEGIASQFFTEMALTISFSLLASLLVALTLIPMLSSKILKVTKEDLARNKKQGFITKNYRKSLDWSLSHRWVIVSILILLLVGSVSLIPMIGTEFLPAFDQGELSINFTLPVGTVLEETDDVAAQIEEQVAQIPEVKTIFTNVGSTGQMNMMSSSEAGSVRVTLVELSKRERTTQEVMEELRNRINIPGVDLTIDTQQGMGGAVGGSPVAIKIKGDELAVLERLAEQTVNEVSQVEGIRNTADTFDEGRPQLNIIVDRNLASQFGLRVGQIANTIRSAIQGTVATRYEVGGDEYDIRVKLKDRDLDTVNELENLTLMSPTGVQVPLNRLAKLEIDEGPKEILRINQVRYAEVTADLYQIDLGTAMANVKERLATNVNLPVGYEYSYEGQFQNQQESFESLFYAFLLSIVLVYMVMASQFESLIHPFIIMFTVPMALIGVLIGIFVTGQNLSVPSLIGVITLAGIVVNNAIVLVDYINQERDSGKSKREAILSAAPIRLRPIMMTALTTILGLLPLSLGIGEGAELQQPIAVVVISGLSFATLLTLYLLPVIYSLITDLRDWLYNKFSSKSEEIVAKNI